MNRRFRALPIALALVLAACGTGGGDGSSTNTGEADGGTGLTVVATTTMLGDIVSNVVGDEATVEVLMPVGADPHDFQASSRQVSTLSTADLVVANGLGLEEGLHDVLEGAESDGAHVFEVAPMLDPIPFGGHGHEGEHESDDTAEECDPEMTNEDEGEDHDHEEDAEEAHDHGGCDPHVWMDPLRMAEAARLIASELEEAAPDGSWPERAEAYATELTDANAQIEETLSAIPEDGRVMVTNHEAFGYFADLYGFEIVGVVVPGGSTLGDPSSSALADLVAVINQEDVRAIFTDSSAPSALAESIAEEAGSEVAVVQLFTGSLGEPGSGADTLIGMLSTNAELVAEALS